MLENKGAGKSSDIYGFGKLNLYINNLYIGAILYEMLVGEPPYYNDDITELYKNISKG
jgi:serine/threonine protein kinase